ncbi:hypothetical protein AAW01_05035 [Aurantiacibacter gangjinensis]|uniref:Sulfotransferase n=1 Tax=Aurantiacibacter gangjinensis TaxID=502682 RepID=A0A0G9MWR0_9SPHN|nr:hypothetical protein AAW01_05035 [Aurantiacibacter gangjinensis]
MIGWLETAWRKGLSARPSLDPDVLWEKALADAPAHGETACRSAEDVADFRLRLEKLCDALASEAQLNPLGETMAHGQLVRVIRQRLNLGVLWRKAPALLDTPLAPPIIVAGQMRSGTTRIHRLLAADPSLSATRFCDSWHPVPRSPDTRPAWSALSLAFAKALDPWLDTIHPFGATRADEELGWLAAALDHAAYEAQWRIPGFTAFSEARDPAPVYHEFARMLRTDASWHDNAHRPRVLKVPQFAEDLPALLAQFPDARVVMTRRCENDLIRSSASLVANQMAIQSDHADYEWIEAEVARKIALRQERMDAALAAFDGPVADVDFDALGENWETEITRIYATLSLPMSDETLPAMREEQRKASNGAHRHHGKQIQAFESSAAQGA